MLAAHNEKMEMVVWADSNAVTQLSGTLLEVGKSVRRAAAVILARPGSDKKHREHQLQDRTAWVTQQN